MVNASIAMGTSCHNIDTWNLKLLLEDLLSASAHFLTTFWQPFDNLLTIGFCVLNWGWHFLKQLIFGLTQNSSGGAKRKASQHLLHSPLTVQISTVPKKGKFSTWPLHPKHIALSCPTKEWQHMHVEPHRQCCTLIILCVEWRHIRKTSWSNFQQKGDYFLFFSKALGSDTMLKICYTLLFGMNQSCCSK